MHAISTGDYKGVKSLLKTFDPSAFSPATLDCHAYQLLNNAVTRKYSIITKLLLGKLIPKFSLTSSNGKQLLFTAVKNCDIESVKVLLKSGADVNLKLYGKKAAERNGVSPLHIAIEQGALDIVTLLIGVGADLNALGELNKTPLHFAVSKLPILEYLLKAGANLNLQDDDQSTPLHVAVIAESLEAVELLVEHGANLETSDAWNRRPLHFAVQVTPKILEYLLNKGCNINAQDIEGRTPLHEAVATRCLRSVKILLAHGANARLMDKRNEEAVHVAATSSSEILKEILSSTHYDSWFALNQALRTPINTVGCVRNAELLIEHGAEVNAEYNFGGLKCNPLHRAAKLNYHKVAERLLNLGVDIDATASTYGISPLYFAMQSRSVKCVELFLHRGANINLLPNDFNRPMDYFTSDLGNKVFIGHVVQRRYQKLEVSEQLLKVINSSHKLLEIYKHCEEQIEKMKIEKFCDTTISFYEVLVRSCNQLATFARNENVEEGLNNFFVYEEKFPIYGPTVTRKLLRGMERKKLLDKSETCRRVLFAGLPRFCSDLIFSYLEDRQIRMLVEVFKHYKN